MHDLADIRLWALTLGVALLIVCVLVSGYLSLRWTWGMSAGKSAVLAVLGAVGELLRSLVP